MSEYLMELKNISKSFGENQVLFDVNFDLRPGEIHAIIGENGAGKSTLMNIVDGLLSPNGGEIYVQGELASIHNTFDAQRYGIGFVHQEIALCQDVSVAQNIFMSEINAKKKMNINYQEMEKRAAEILTTIVGDAIDPRDTVSNLPISSQQVVEIAKALSMQCKILILDEPTAALAEREVEALYTIMQNLSARGIGCIYISHRMSEIFEQCHRVSVLRDGHMVSVYDVKGVTVQQLVNDMAGREVNAIYPEKAEKITYSDENVLLEVNDLTDAAGVFENIDFKLYKGEMLGFSGLIGSGRSEIMQGVVGLRKLRSGTVKFHNKNMIGKTPREVFSEGLAYMSEDRKHCGLFLDMDIKNNVSAMYLDHFTNRGMIDARDEAKKADGMAKELNIKCMNISQLVGDLSGGNQQKALIAKILVGKPEIVIFDEPTRGIDVAAKTEIHRLLRKLIGEGLGVIVISSELNEVVGMCDRAIILHEGKIVGEASGQEINSTHIMNYASGAYQLTQN
ncbi:MAG: sugar ABC transporter ATP-binding protein [Christensenella sp.]|uniref:sugar ABC transporter ATP-binding protein n=1 Tax=Christensenella sp. TaxID=1935934 RepID=UPI002B1FE4B4|nr:sugar ABC transporter ATP-binding protein [Christensenella sp.]MEA5004659.1 sugar ABC transporter ATP-binding protein [Christensenella sp.]